MSRDTPPKHKVNARQAYGFFYLQPEREADALDAARRVVRERRGSFENLLGTPETEALLRAGAFEEFAARWGYAARRDGEGRIIHLVRRERPEIGADVVPFLDHVILEAVAPYVDGAELVFANPFGDGWAWRIEDGALRYRRGRVTVAPATPDESAG